MRRTRVLFSLKRRNSWKKRSKNIRRRRRHPLLRNHPPLRRQLDHRPKEIYHPEQIARDLSNSQNVSIFKKSFASGQRVIRLLDVCYGLYFYVSSKRHCSTSAAVVVGSAQRIAQIELKPTSRNGNFISSTRDFFFSAARLA